MAKRKPQSVRAPVTILRNRGGVRFLGTYRFVPPISLEAWARAVVVLGAYLAAVEYGLPWEGDAFAFALALEFGLLVTENILRVGHMYVASNLFVTISAWALAIVPIGAGVALIPLLSSSVALYMYVGWCFSLSLAHFSSASKLDDPEYMRTKWYRNDPEAPRAMRLQAGSFVLVGLTALALRPFDPLFQIAFITFGTKVMWFFTHWIILLMLYQSWRDRDGF